MHHNLTIRPVAKGDDLTALTHLIHAAYQPHAESGLRFWGAHQTVEDTAKRLASGVAWVVVDSSGYLGTATLQPPQADSPVALYRQSGVFSLSQFCIRPDAKGQGLGLRLHNHVLRCAVESGAIGVALDTAQPATRLIALYKGWGYKLVGACDWRPFTNYASVLMYQALPQSANAV